MLYDYFCLCQYIIEDLKRFISIIYVNSSNIFSDIIYKTEGSSNDNSCEVTSNDNGDKDPSYNKDGSREEESFEIEEEIEDIERLMKLSNNAMILDEKLPYSQKDKNSYLNDIRKDPNVKEFFEGKTPNASDLPELNQSLREAKQDKIKELSEAKKYDSHVPSTNSLKNLSEAKKGDNHESSTNSLNNLSSSSLHKSNNSLNDDYTNGSDFKLGNNILDYIIEILINIYR